MKPKRMFLPIFLHTLTLSAIVYMIKLQDISHSCFFCVLFIHFTFGTPSWAFCVCSWSQAEITHVYGTQYLQWAGTSQYIIPALPNFMPVCSLSKFSYWYTTSKCWTTFGCIYKIKLNCSEEENQLISCIGVITHVVGYQRLVLKQQCCTWLWITEIQHVLSSFISRLCQPVKKCEYM
jgi:hypothetical protein